MLILKGKVAGATGLEPAASSVTGQRESNGINVRFDSLPGKSGPEGLRFDFAGSKVESHFGARRARKSDISKDIFK